MPRGCDCFQAALFCGGLDSGHGSKSSTDPLYGANRGHPNFKPKRNTAQYNNGELTPALASFEVIKRGMVGSLNGGGPIQASSHIY
jgi:hypothetical protein